MKRLERPGLCCTTMWLTARRMQGARLPFTYRKHGRGVRHHRKERVMPHGRADLIANQAAFLYLCVRRHSRLLTDQGTCMKHIGIKKTLLLNQRSQHYYGLEQYVLRYWESEFPQLNRQESCRQPDLHQQRHQADSLHQEAPSRRAVHN